MPGFVGESFSPIIAYNRNGAVIHYHADPDSCATLDGQGLLLVDSGGQYLEGTTDITRVFLLGEPTEQQRRDYTMVLKAHIALAVSLFPEGTYGMALDTLARKPLWEQGLNYGHGTGHGVGAFLNVHEGPASISPRIIPEPLRGGMVFSNEPGLYREGSYGIRLENLILVQHRFNTPFGSFLGFETLTPFPFEKKLLDLTILSSPEAAWLEEYHRWVYQTLSPYIGMEEKRFLADKCGVSNLSG